MTETVACYALNVLAKAITQQRELWDTLRELERELSPPDEEPTEAIDGLDDTIRCLASAEAEPDDDEILNLGLKLILQQKRDQ